MMVTCDNTESSDLSSHMSQQDNIPSFSDISSPHKRSDTSHQFYRPLSDKSFWPNRAHSAFQPYCIGSIEDQRSISSFKLPPNASPPKETSMPPQIANEVPFDMSSQNPYPFSDLKTAYESMMIGYFMPAKDDCCSNGRECQSKVNQSSAENKGSYTVSDVYESNSVISKNTTHHTRKSTLQRSKRISHSDGYFMNHFVPSTDCCTLEDECSVETNDSSSTFSTRELKAAHDSCPEKKHFDYPTPIHRRASNDFSSWMNPAWDVETSSSQPLFASTFNKTTSSTSNDPQKPENNLGRFSVLPPVSTSTTPGYTDGDNLSWLSYSPGNPQTGPCYAPFNPFCGIIPDSSPLNCSPRHSGRSSYSNRSRNKRALSNSPLSADGIDLNTLIRMSPTSLVAYINGSRSSSSCVSSGGEKAGSYGHLSARNSSSSPYSGSNSSSNRRSCSYTPQTGTPVNSCSHIANESSTNCPSEKTKEDLESLHDSLLVMQAIQELESSINYIPNADTIIGPSLTQQQPEFDNLQVLPQDLAFFSTEDYVLPAVHTYLPSPTLSKPPPPTYDQHMARKAILQKHSSSDSSQPSNSSSFESSEGDKTGSTDTESNRMYACRWLECSAVFHDQDEFVTHIEKVHIDSKKGDDFVCFWKLCPRRLHPFNARYKLLVHMRIHSGDKPNKCTFQGCKKAFSRLENLKIHLRSHTGERPYSCTFPACTKTFSNSSDRTKHQKTHNDTKPYVCQIVGCGKRYTDPSSLRKHVKKSHPQNKEPDRKKIKGGLEDPKDLTDCLVIQPLRLMDASPTDSSQPSSDAGLLYVTDSTSPSSHNSSPRNKNDCENLSANNNHLRVPILPPLPQTFKSSPQTAKTRCSSNVFPSMKKPSSVLSYSNIIYNSPSPVIRKHE